MVSKRVTSQDVARFAGVSRTTVSLVLNNVPQVKISPLTRRRVVEAAAQLGYVPDAAAQALASRRAQTIGLIFIRQSHHISSDAFITNILSGLMDIIHQNEMRLLVDVVQPECQRETYLQLVRSKRIDGILLSGPMFDDQALQSLHDEGFPVVIIGRLPGSRFSSVDIDNCAAAENAVAHLIRLGHRHIACITNASLEYTAAAERLAGYQRALETAGLVYNPALVRQGEFSVDSGYQKMQELLHSRVPFTAAFVASDTLALGAKTALREAGIRIPDDIALVGFDDLPFARYLEPPLTTVRLPVAELAYHATEMLIQLLVSGIPDRLEITLNTHLVVRKSCGGMAS